MAPSPREKRRVRPTRVICAPASTSTGSRLSNDADFSPNLVVDHPRLSAGAQPMVGAALPFLSQLLLLHTYRDRTIRSLPRVMAWPLPSSTLSSLQQGRLRPCAGQENDQCLTHACSFGLRSPRSCISTTKRGCMTIRPEVSATPSVNPLPALPVLSATRCRRPRAARQLLRRHPYARRRRRSPPRNTSRRHP